MSCYFGRRSFSSLTSVAIDEDITVEQVGFISSGMAMGYSFGKLWATLAIDGISPVVIYPIIIFLVGGVNYLFANSTSTIFLVAFWFCNGCLHGIAWVR